MGAVIRQLDPFFHGSVAGNITALANQSGVLALGIPVATLGSSGYCTFHERVVFIVTASPNVLAGGIPVARERDLMDCGAVLAATQHSVFVNGE